MCPEWVVFPESLKAHLSNSLGWVFLGSPASAFIPKLGDPDTHPVDTGSKITLRALPLVLMAAGSRE